MFVQVVHNQSGLWAVIANDLTVYTSRMKTDATTWARNYLRYRGGGKLVIQDIDGPDVIHDAVVRSSIIVPVSQ